MNARTSVSREKMICEPPMSNVNPLSVRDRQSPPYSGFCLKDQQICAFLMQDRASVQAG